MPPSLNLIVVAKIRLDDSGRLHVHPRTPLAMYSFVWRDATSVRWNESDQSFHTLPIDDFSPADEFMQIRMAVLREFGGLLSIDHSTLIELDPDLANTIRELAASPPNSD